MAKKPEVGKRIREAKNSLKEIMRDNLAVIAQNMIGQIIGKLERSTESTRLNAIKDISPVGISAYRDQLLVALSVVSYEALQAVRKEVPKKRDLKLAEGNEQLSFKLAEFDKLPVALQKMIKTQNSLLIDSQISDLEKIIYFQFTSSVNSTDSVSIVKKDIEDSAEEFIGGPALEAAAGVQSANIINSARDAFLYDDEVLSELEGFEFVNEDPVTTVCQELNGKVFAKDDPEVDRIRPPLHWNCKSWLSPVLLGKLGDRKIEKVQLTKGAQKQIQFSEQGCCTLHQFSAS